MTNDKLLAALGTLRGQVAQMTPGPWVNETTNYQPPGYPRALIHFGDGFKFNTVIAPNVLRSDADGIAALRNAADELLAAAEAALPAVEALREEVAKECICTWCVTAQRALESADAALAALAKKLEAAS